VDAETDVEGQAEPAPGRRDAAARKELEAVRASLQQLLARVERALALPDVEPANDASGPDVLVGASDQPFNLSPSTFRRMAHEGRFRTMPGPRGRLQAWRSEVRAALDQQMRSGGGQLAREVADDPFRELLAAGVLVESPATHCDRRGSRRGGGPPGSSPPRS
jgi:hypothetical protein